MPVVLLSHAVRVPVASGADASQVVELGEIKVPVPKRPRLSELAPALEGVREDGSKFQLAGLKGRWVLLVFGADAAPPSATASEFSCLTSYAAEGSMDGKVEVVVLNLDSGKNSFANAQLEKPLPWPVVHVGPWTESKAAADYGVVAFPEIILADPEGRIAGLHLRGQKLVDVLDAVVSPGK